MDPYRTLEKPSVSSQQVQVGPAFLLACARRAPDAAGATFLSRLFLDFEYMALIAGVAGHSIVVVL